VKSQVIIICRGIVQGIGFRPFVYRMAVKHKLSGYVRNQGDAGVKIVVEGSEESIKRFLDSMHNEKPYLAKYEDFHVDWEKFSGKYDNFIIQKSSKNKVGGVSYLPPDIAICSDCLNDMTNPSDPRYHYPFTSCAICGPRYTTITRLPYDRPNTTMVDFPLCSFCLTEYENPLDRRYHAQTTCCSKCGPAYALYDSEGNNVNTFNSIKKASELIAKGSIIAIKGIGGTHLACSATEDATVLRLRTRKGGRKNKPFALISSSIDKIQTFANISKREKELLLSFRRPIVLLEKKQPFPLSKFVSPNLFNVGVMLPYSGIHSLLLDNLTDAAIILTSANPSDSPMYIDNKTILSKGDQLADYFLLHNRDIYQRADDSVIRISNNTPAIIRRSRGWVPEPINLPFDLGELTAIGVGPLLTSTGAILMKDRCFLTQYIGNVDTLETLNFLDSSLTHLSSLLGITGYDVVGCDLHPAYLSTKLALDYTDKFNSSLTKAQHHHAHSVSLMVDNELPIDSQVVSIAADGVGYGTDGKIWGGEILHCSYTDFKRVAHLEEQLMVGGDRATYYPVRMLAGILSNVLSESELSDLLLKSYVDGLPGKEREIQVILVQLKKQLNLVRTTSTGRILAATSALLHACYERTYEGEPAIVLESLAHSGKLDDKLTFTYDKKQNDIIPTTPIILQSLQFLSSGIPPANIALAVQNELATQFASKAIKYAKEHSIDIIGFTGGVAYNDYITTRIAKIVEAANLRFIQHNSLPCGDGGISAGQSVIAAAKLLSK
jgi:hydrogenase maturation protein HypF